MNRHRWLATWSGAILGAFSALLLLAAQSNASPRGEYTEEFHQTYALSAGGRVELNNVNGGVHITAWDQNQVKVDAVKYANSKERLGDAKIEIHADSDSISIRTNYRDHDRIFSDSCCNNPPSVEYTLTVPRSARLDEINLVNGPLDIHGLTGEVRASCVNGKMSAGGLHGDVKLSSVNGRLQVKLAPIPHSEIELSSVNGALELTLPSESNAELEASTVSGGIENDFGLRVRHHHFVGHDLRGELGNGGARIKLSNVNGHIDIRRANDGKSLSSVKDMNRSDRDNGDEDEDDQI